MSVKISKDYAALHKKYPELRPRVAFDRPLVWTWVNDAWRAVHQDDAPGTGSFNDSIRLATALPACFMACLRACAERGLVVSMADSPLGPSMENAFGFTAVCFDVSSPHTIIKVMDKVMQLPKVGA
jgi:hypothetical protein